MSPHHEMNSINIYIVFIEILLHNILLISFTAFNKDDKNIVR